MALHAGVDNIRASSVQYIVTEYVPTSATIIEADVEIFKTSANQALFCSRQGLAENTYTLFYIKDQGWRFDYGNSTAAVYSPSAEVGGRYLIKTSSEGLWIDGEKVIDKTPVSFSPTCPLVLFASYVGSPEDGIDNRADMRLYSFKAWEPDGHGGLELKLDLKPCFASDNTFALKDTVSGRVFSNAVPGTPLSSKFVIPAENGVGDVAALTNALRMLDLAADTGSSRDKMTGAEVWLQPGRYDVSGCAMDAASHIVFKRLNGGRFGGLGDSPEDVVLDGGGEAGNQLRVADFSSLPNYWHLYVTNVTLTGGYNVTGNGGGAIGGYTVSGGFNSATYFDSCVLSNNYAVGTTGEGGGGIYKGIARNCRYVGNTSLNGGGHRGGRDFNCEFIGNRATGGAATASGGGGASDQDVVEDCRFVDNVSAYYGGGLSLKPGVVASGCVFIGNSVEGPAQGGVYGAGGAVCGGTVSNCVFTANSDSDRPGLYGSTTDNATLVDCIVTNTLARRSVFSRTNLMRCYVADCGRSAADAAYALELCGNFQNEAGVYTNANTVFERCSADAQSDFIVNRRLMINCTIRDCATGSGGAIGPVGGVYNTLIVGSTGGPDLNAESIPDMTNCMYTTISGEAAEGRLSGSIRTTSARFAPGDARPYQLLGNSRAVNAGYEAPWLLEAVGAYDVAMNPRVRFGRIDIGAVEGCYRKPGVVIVFR